MAEWESLGVAPETGPQEATESAGLQVDPALVEAAEELEGRLQDLLGQASSLGVLLANRSAAGLDWSAGRLQVDGEDEAEEAVATSRLISSRRRAAHRLASAATWLRALERSDTPDGPYRGLQGLARRQPLATLVVSAGAGALLGMLLRKLP